MENLKANINTLHTEKDTMIDCMNEMYNDLKIVLEKWFWMLDEYNDHDNPQFNEILKKYNLTLDDILSR